MNINAIYLVVGREIVNGKLKHLYVASNNGGRQSMTVHQLEQFARNHIVANVKVSAGQMQGIGISLLEIPTYQRSPEGFMMQVKGLSEQEIIQKATPYINQIIQKLNDKKLKEIEQTDEEKKKRIEYIVNKLSLCNNILQETSKMKDLTNNKELLANVSRYIKQLDIDNADESLQSIIEKQGVTGLLKGVEDRIQRCKDRAIKYHLSKELVNGKPIISICKQLNDNIEALRKKHKETYTLIRTSKEDAKLEKVGEAKREKQETKESEELRKFIEEQQLELEEDQAIQIIEDDTDLNEEDMIALDTNENSIEIVSDDVDESELIALDTNTNDIEVVSDDVDESELIALVEDEKKEEKEIKAEEKEIKAENIKQIALEKEIKHKEMQIRLRKNELFRKMNRCKSQIQDDIRRHYVAEEILKELIIQVSNESDNTKKVNYTVLKNNLRRDVINYYTNNINYDGAVYTYFVPLNLIMIIVEQLEGDFENTYLQEPSNCIIKGIKLTDYIDETLFPIDLSAECIGKSHKLALDTFKTVFLANINNLPDSDTFINIVSRACKFIEHTNTLNGITRAKLCYCGDENSDTANAIRNIISDLNYKILEEAKNIALRIQNNPVDQENIYYLNKNEKINILKSTIDSLHNDMNKVNNYNNIYNNILNQIDNISDKNSDLEEELNKCNYYNSAILQHSNQYAKSLKAKKEYSKAVRGCLNMTLKEYWNSNKNWDNLYKRYNEYYLETTIQTTASNKGIQEALNLYDDI